MTVSIPEERLLKIKPLNQFGVEWKNRTSNCFHRFKIQTEPHYKVVCELCGYVNFVIPRKEKRKR